MDAEQELARRLTDSLAALAPRNSDAMAINNTHRLAIAAADLNLQLAELPAEIRHLLHTADSGFASSGAWVDKTIEQQNEQLTRLVRATRMVADWHGPDGGKLERMFVIRGHIRGWAHRWREEEKGPAQIGSDQAFVSFAAECLTAAGIDGNHGIIIERALGKDWRTAPVD